MDAVRWLPPPSLSTKTAILSLYDPATATSTVETHSFNPQDHLSSLLSPLSSYPSLSRISSLKTTSSLIAFSTLSGSLTFLSHPDPDYDSGSQATSVSESGFHSGPILNIDLLDGGECVTVGEDGRVNLAGGSSGAVLAWDLRWPQQPIVLSGAGIGDRSVPSVSESEVWEVQFDCHTQSSNINSMSSSKILPVMMCSEDGILAVLEAGGAEPTELLEEHCAINWL